MGPKSKQSVSLGHFLEYSVALTPEAHLICLKIVTVIKKSRVAKAMAYIASVQMHDVTLIARRGRVSIQESILQQWCGSKLIIREAPFICVFLKESKNLVYLAYIWN